MNAKDLLTALNDIDPKLLEGVDPWGTPAKKVRRSPWVKAVAAALVLCAGVGGWFALTNGPHLFSQDRASSLSAGDTTSTAYTLTFAENTTNSSQSTSWVLGNEGDVDRELTQEELDSLSQQDGLSWMEGYQLSGTAYISQEGQISWMMIRGSHSQDSQGMEAFVLYLQPGELPRCEARDVCSFLNSANNQVNGIDVWGVVSHSGRGYVDPDTQKSLYDSTTTYWTMFQLEDEDSTGVALGVLADRWGFEEQEAHDLAEQASLQLLDAPVVLPTWAPEEKDAVLSFPDLTMEAYEDTFPDYYGPYSEEYVAPRNLASGGTYKGKSLTMDDVRGMWGGELPWQLDLGENVTPYASASFSEEGELVGIFVSALREPTENDGFQVFSICLVPQVLSGEWGALAQETLSHANCRINGVDIAAGSTLQTLYYDQEDGTQTSMDHTVYNAEFYLDDIPVMMSVRAFSSEASGLSAQQAQTFVEQVVEASLSRGVNLESVDKE